jgi:hypothetical protein
MTMQETVEYSEANSESRSLPRVLNYLNVSCSIRNVIGDLMVSVLATGPKNRGFKPDRERRNSKGAKNPQQAFITFGGDVKPSVPCRRLYGMLEIPSKY